MTKSGKIREFVISEFKKSGQNWFVELHLKVVERLALELAKREAADKEIVELSVWLHDIYYSNVPKQQRADEMSGDYDNHEVFGAREARKIMLKNGYDEKRVEAVEKCILEHRCKGSVPSTTESKILASADAMSHIENFSMLLFVGFAQHKKTNKEVHAWLSRKIERDWNKKIFFPEAKDMIKEKYAQVLSLLEEMRKAG